MQGLVVGRAVELTVLGGYNQQLIYIYIQDELVRLHILVVNSFANIYGLYNIRL